MQRVFPAAIKTFTLYRRLQTVQASGGGNITPVSPFSVTPVATGLSIAFKDLQDTVIADSAGYVFGGYYFGMTFTDTPIIIGDILADETEMQRDGVSPVRYAVEGKTIYPIFTKLHLRRMDIGV